MEEFNYYLRYFKYRPAFSGSTGPVQLSSNYISKDGSSVAWMKQAVFPMLPRCLLFVAIVFILHGYGLGRAGFIHLLAGGIIRYFSFHLHVIM